MVNKILAIRWLKNVIVRNQSYELAAWLRDEEKKMLESYDEEYKSNDTTTRSWLERDRDVYKKIESDTSKSPFLQYKYIQEIINSPNFNRHNLTKLYIMEVARKDFAQVVREEILNKILE